jgi:hypothetical protein
MQKSTYVSVLAMSKLKTKLRNNSSYNSTRGTEYLRINIMMVQDLSENCKRWLKESKEAPSKNGKTPHVHGLKT